ncbi:adenine phosphoribosyltransferase [Candidatus Micrarchaeota archaeon]|nr:adenine phosphoribosyltransferase [Candidatus Micrarchaeota archaeon]
MNNLPLEDNIKKHIRSIPNFPKPGIDFKDITPLLREGRLMKKVADYFSDIYSGKEIDAVMAAEARGFIFGSVLAFDLNVGFVPLRKPGKLPYKTIKQEFNLEYGKDAFEIHEDAIRQGEKILIVDDVIATGGTAEAAARLVEKLGGDVVGFAFLIELSKLNGRDKIKQYRVESLVKY